MVQSKKEKKEQRNTGIACMRADRYKAKASGGAQPGKQALYAPKAGQEITAEGREIERRAEMAGNSTESSGKKRRGPGRPFQPGQSGNPNGRPKMPEDVRKKLKAATPEAVQLLIDVMKNEDEKTALRMDAAKTIIERVYGKPTQPIDNAISGGLDVGLSDADRRLLDNVSKRLGRE